MRIKGKVEVFTPTTVSGWLAVFGKPDDAVRLELLLDGVSIATAPANGFRPDVETLGFGDGTCQFDINIAEALTVAEAERLQLRIVGSDLCLELPRGVSWSPEKSKGSPGRTDQFGLGTHLGSAVGGPLKVFIVGSPRSGTSALLRAMQHVVGLHAHGESHVIPAIAQAVFHLRSYYERFKNNTGDLLIRQLRIDRIEEPVFESIRAFYRSTYDGEGWVDKTPTDEAVHSAPLIRRIFPDAKVIVTRRTGVEVVESYRRKFKAPLREACENWARVMEGIAILRQQCPDILEIDQFDLANAPDEAGLRVAVYLGLPELAAKLGAFLANDREDRTSTHDWKLRLTLSDVTWTEEEREDFIRICGPLMHENEYWTP